MSLLPYIDNYMITLPAGATLGAYIRVKLNTSGQVVAAGVTDKGIGYLTERGATSGSNCTVRLNNAPSQNAVVSEAVEVGDVLWAAANGKVADTDAGSGVIVGIALTAGSADGDLITLLPTNFVT